MKNGEIIQDGEDFAQKHFLFLTKKRGELDS